MRRASFTRLPTALIIPSHRPKIQSPCGIFAFREPPGFSPSIPVRASLRCAPWNTLITRPLFVQNRCRIPRIQVEMLLPSLEHRGCACRLPRGPHRIVAEQWRCPSAPCYLGCTDEPLSCVARCTRISSMQIPSQRIPRSTRSGAQHRRRMARGDSARKGDVSPHAVLSSLHVRFACAFLAPRATQWTSLFVTRLGRVRRVGDP